ncbi:DUF551 domain-containing protein [Geomonas sp. Red32]|uniref:DUF551 domain-containing protein n=1 Tax=Geomonas sp. Red32 TaxID=2912856 RepID=UPI00202CC6F1|nr:DUF551 domain-containing protein [Geomonas sp. Red32]MCM0081805.1 DUF551 domain-containing protein [Geomonas sp. Red32]
MPWISVSKELPDSETTVLINCPDDDEPVWFGWWDGENWYENNGAALPEGYVSHWQHFPDPATN